ncbi:MAG TPA: chromate efflux transporter [Pseudomonadales bacterium]|nr:chromate efflux transporter [Pseudomonadales bacterium]
MNRDAGSKVQGTEQNVVSFREALRVWLKIGFLSFGGPAGQIALMHKLIVEEKRWIGEERFLHALNYCTLLPGPEAQQLATYIGWLLHGTRGGLTAGLLFIVPGALAILALSVIYTTLGHEPLIAGIFLGLKAAVMALVVEAVLRVGRRALRSTVARAAAAVAFVALFVFALPFPLVVIGAGLFGYVWTRSGRLGFGGGSHGASAAAAPTPVIDDAALHRAPPGAGRALRVLASWLPLWFAPMAIAAAWLGPQHLYVHVGMFFAGMAVVTFGGAYAVLAYVAQRAVVDFGWLSSQQMLDGLALAETTPGPLILVVQFVAFVAGFQSYGLTGGMIAAFIALWATFVPCFLWIFLGAPYVESLRHQKPLAGALAAITAAVVGVILNLALWFALHALFAQSEAQPIPGTALRLPVFASIDLRLAALTVLSMALTFAARWSTSRTLLVMSLAGVAVYFLTG